MFAALIAALITVSACAIRQTVTPVTLAPTAARDICIIEHPATRASFLEEYQRVLQARGFQTRVVPENSPHTLCPVMTTYIARW